MIHNFPRHELYGTSGYFATSVINSVQHTIVSAYAPTMTYPDEEKERFPESLKATIGRVPRSDKLIVLGDFNARVGRNHETRERGIGHHGMGNENANGSLDNYAPLHYIYLLLTCSVSDFHVRVMFSAPHIGIKTCN